jgi:hypothetical protein
VTLARSHRDQDELYARAKEFRRMIAMTLGNCTSPFVCLECRKKLNLYVDALLHLPDTIVDTHRDLS